jgi:hypothetical protein
VKESEGKEKRKESWRMRGPKREDRKERREQPIPLHFPLGMCLHSRRGKEAGDVRSGKNVRMYMSNNLSTRPTVGSLLGHWSV